MATHGVQDSFISIESILKNGTPDQFFIIEKWSRIVGKVLSNVEIALSEGRRYTVLKRFLNDIMYDGTRNKILPIVKNPDNGFVQEKIKEITASMMDAIDNRIEITFPDAVQQRAIKTAVRKDVEEIIFDVLGYFQARK